MAAALVGVETQGKCAESSLRQLGMLNRRGVVQPFDSCPVLRFFESPLLIFRRTSLPFRFVGGKLKIVPE